jgi:DNA adenine methylase
MGMAENMTLKAPFPYFGGKAPVAHHVWAALGQPAHYIEPFFGSGAVLLARPFWDPEKHTETINDKDGFVCNAWRALQHAPDEVAKHCDWPVNHADLNARRKALLTNHKQFIEGLTTDPEWHDVKMAGYWIWAASCWIGSGLTSGVHKQSLRQGICQMPHVGHGGKGVHKQSLRQGICQMPHVGHGGKGIHKASLTSLPADAAHVQDPYNVNLYTWFRQLSERLRYVRVVCGDWTRVCGGNWQDNIGDVGIFFDPPYGVEDRDDVYSAKDKTIAADVNAWCLERGTRKTHRIVLAGYYEEHQNLISAGWTIIRWQAQGGYGNQRGRRNANAAREALFISPYCTKKMTLF